MTDIRTLEHTSFDELYTAWEDAFREYERTWSYAELAQLLQRRGYTPHISFGAFDDGRLVSFILNCEGYFNGVNTAYDSGTGTVKEHRGKGLVKQIFEASIPIIKQQGIQQYLLEVLQHNTTAVNIYANAGFKVHRSLNYFVRAMSELQLSDKVISPQFDIRDIGTDIKNELIGMWDFIPSWQNNFESIARIPLDFIIKGVFDGGKLAGYGIIEPGSGDITQLAVSEPYRRKGIGSGLLKELLRHNRHPNVKVINTDTAYTEMTAFLQYNGMDLSGQQYEMIKVL